MPNIWRILHYEVSEFSLRSTIQEKNEAWGVLMATEEGGLDLLESIIEGQFGKSVAYAVTASLAMVATLAIKGGRPIPLTLTGSASSLKSTSLEIIAGGLNDGPEELAIVVDNFTAKSWVSASKDDEGVDLLESIPSKVLITSDLGVVFNKPLSQFLEFASITTRILDGFGFSYASSKKISGNRDPFAFVWLGATIEQPTDKIWRVYSSLGPRLYYLSMPDGNTNPSVDELVNLLTTGADYRAKILSCNRAVSAFFRSIQFRVNSVTWNREKDSREALVVLAKAAKILRILRAGISERSVNLENSVRCVSIFHLMASGFAVLHRRNWIDMEDVKDAILTISVDSGIPIRKSIFLHLVKNGTVTIKQFVASSEFSEKFTRKELKKLQTLNFVEVSTNNEIKLTEYYQKLADDLAPYFFPQNGN